jgi:PAS domain S-box-containing protein
MAGERVVVAEVRANRNSLTAAVADRDFRVLAETIAALCWIADAQGYITWYNPRWYEYTGTTAADMEGWGWQSVHDPKSLPEVLERWKAAISSGQRFEMVFPIRGADGVMRPFLTRINPAFDEDGNITHWFGVNIDISLQVEAEDAFQKSEARFRLLADSMPQMVWSATPDGRHDYFNARYYEFTGVPFGFSDGTGWLDVVHPDDRAGVVAAWQASLICGAAYQQEFRLRHSSGVYRWVLGRAQAGRDAAGGIERWYGSCTDIEEIVQARQVLKRSRDELEAEVIARTGERNLLARLVETTDVKILALDTKFTVLAVNAACAEEYARVFGVAVRPGCNLLGLLDGLPEQRAAVEATWRRALSGYEGTLIESHGDPARVRREYEITFRTLRDAAGAPIGAFHFVQDVTEKLRDQALLVEAREALLQAQKLDSLGQLTGGVAHDFNNLLTPIIGSLDILQRRGVGGAREQRLIHGAYESAERARVLVQRLLAFARRQPLQSLPTDVGALIGGLVDLLGSTMGPLVTLSIEIEPDLPAALADPGQLEMAILNLGVNARDAMSGAGTLRILGACATAADARAPPLAPGAYVRIAVADTGVGMDESTRARAIEPFFSTKGVGKGTGLGLSMAHGLASQLGGALTIESAPGQGTEVAIWLPACARPEAPGVARAGEAGAAAFAGTALLVDDEEHIRATATVMLAELGLCVLEAASAEAALQMIDGGLRPDVLITDHLMPGMTGVELAHAVRARGLGFRVVIVSGFAEAEGIDPALPRLVKPFVQSELARLIVGAGG